MSRWTGETPKMRCGLRSTANFPVLVPAVEHRHPRGGLRRARIDAAFSDCKQFFRN